MLLEDGGCVYFYLRFLIKTKALFNFYASAIWTDVYIFMYVFFLINTKAISTFSACAIWKEVYIFMYVFLLKLELCLLIILGEVGQMSISTSSFLLKLKLCLRFDVSGIWMDVYV